MILELAPARIVEILERDLTLSHDDLARALGVNRRTLERWRSGECYPQREARARFSALLDLNHHLRETFETPEDARAWVHASSRYLGGLTPADALRSGRADRVEAALEALDSGVFV